MTLIFEFLSKFVKSISKFPFSSDWSPKSVFSIPILAPEIGLLSMSVIFPEIIWE